MVNKLIQDPPGYICALASHAGACDFHILELREVKEEDKEKNGSSFGYTYFCKEIKMKTM